MVRKGVDDGLASDGTSVGAPPFLERTFRLRLTLLTLTSFH